MARLLSSFALLFLLFQLPCSAQSLRLGLKAGADFDRTTGARLDNSFSGYFFGGGYVGLQFSSFRAQGEILFSRTEISTGSNFANAFRDYVTEPFTTGQGSFRMNELSLPLVFALRIVHDAFWFEFGPQYTAIVSIRDPNDFLIEADRVFKRGYVSGLAGLSLELPIGLHANLRYVVGITDRNNTPVSEYWRTSHFQLSLGYSFLK